MQTARIPRRGFSDPAFAAGGKSEHDLAVEALCSANNAALATSCALSAVLSWFAPPNPEGDDRDPAAMLTEQLEKAEASAVLTLQRVERLRHLLTKCTCDHPHCEHPH
jgi:hypothetical protein